MNTMVPFQALMIVFGEEDIEAASRERKRRARNSNKDTLHFTVVIVLALCQE